MPACSVSISLNSKNESSIELIIRRMLEKYKFVRRIGDGTFGEIFQVCLRSTGEMFAMKKIPEVEGREQLFETEIRVMMKTFHPNIVKIYEVLLRIPIVLLRRGPRGQALA